MSSQNMNTRNTILQATWELLEAARGKDVRMTDIAKRAGVSRQAVYLHFPTRTDLLVATPLYIDEVKNVDERLAASRAAETGIDRLDAFIEAWGGYIQEIHGVAKALMMISDTDEAAKRAWDGRLQAIREGCRAVIDALHADGMLSPRHSMDEATDIVSALLSVQVWEHFTLTCGWSQAFYVEKTKELARQSVVCESPILK